MQELIDFLQRKAKQSAWFDDPEPDIMAFSGGNIDDAYTGGQQDGEVLLAREILSKFFGVQA